MRRLILGLALLCLLVPALAVQAQAPDAIKVALANLSQKVGHTVTINDLSNWTFEQQIFPNAGMGCPQPGAVYAAVQTPGVQFTLVYQGTAYDYRVSNDQQIVVLCNSAVATDVPAPCPPPNDPAFLAPRLSIGIQARVVAGGIPNNIRDLPGSSGKLLGEIPPGQTFTVLDGPRCSLLDKIVWWQVSFNGITGWTGEGQNGVYWLESLTQANATLSIPLKSVITSANAGQVTFIPELQGNSIVALSPDGDKFAQAIMNSIRINFVGSTQPPLNFLHESIGINISANALAFDSTGKWLVAGYPDGRVILIDTTATPAPSLVLTMTGHTGKVNSVAFSPDGKLILSAGDDMTVRLWDSSTGASVAVLAGHQNSVLTAAFSADGSTIISRDSAGIVNVWRVGTGAAG